MRKKSRRNSEKTPHGVAECGKSFPGGVPQSHKWFRVLRTASSGFSESPGAPKGQGCYTFLQVLGKLVSGKQCSQGSEAQSGYLTFLKYLGAQNMATINLTLSASSLTSSSPTYTA